MYQHSNDASGSAFAGYSSRGADQLNPTAVQASDVITGYNAYAHDGTVFDLVGKIRHRVESISVGDIASYIEFYTSDIAGLEREVARIHSTGRLQLNEDGLTLANSAATVSGTLRWSGSDFEGYDGSDWLSLTASGGGGGGEWSTDPNGIYYDSGNVGIGTNSDASDLLTVSGTSTFIGNLTVDANAIVIIANQDAAASLYLYADEFDDNADGWRVWSATDNNFKISSYATGSWVDRFQINTDGTVYVGDSTNTDMTIGLTINQGANDDQILALKSSDIAHGITGITETDTYFYAKKLNADSGGAALVGLSEINLGLIFGGILTTDDTTKTTGSHGAIILDGAKKSGTGTTSIGTDGNIVAMKNNWSTCWILDAEGDTWQTGDLTIENAGTPRILVHTTADSSAGVNFQNDGHLWATGINSSSVDDSYYIYSSTGDAYPIQCYHDGSVIFGGNVGINTDTASAILDVNSTSTNTIGSYKIWENDADGVNFLLGKSRGGSVGSYTAVQDNDALGRILFQGTDGDQFLHAAAIAGQVDGTPANNVMYGELLFQTNEGTLSTLTTRMRIGSNGSVAIGEDIGSAFLDTSDLSVQRDTARATVSMVTSSDTATVQSNLVLWRSRGSIGSETTVVDDDRVGFVNFAAYDGTDDQYSALVSCYVDGAVSTGVVPMRIAFETSETTSAGRAERLSILSDGSIKFYDNTISGTGDIYCNDIYTASGTVYIGDEQISSTAPGVLDFGGAEIQNVTGINEGVSDGGAVVFVQKETVASGTSSVNFDLPQTAQWFEVYVRARSGRSGDDTVVLTFNNDTGTNYNSTYFAVDALANVGGSSVDGVDLVYMRLGDIYGVDNPNRYAPLSFKVYNYTQEVETSVLGENWFDFDGTDDGIVRGNFGGSYTVAASVTSMQIELYHDNFIDDTEIIVYGYGDTSFVRAADYTKGRQELFIEYATTSGIDILPGRIDIEDGSDEYALSVSGTLFKDSLSLSADTWYYVYAKPPVVGNYLSESEIELSTTEPGRDVVKRGYYHGSNTNWRCFSAFYSDVNSEVKPFMQIGDEWKVTGSIINQDVAAFSSTSWTDVTFTLPFGETFAIIDSRASYGDAYSHLRYKKNGVSGENYTTIGTVRVDNTRAYGEYHLPIDSDKKGEIKWSDAGTQLAYLNSEGFVLPDWIAPK